MPNPSSSATPSSSSSSYIVAETSESTSSSRNTMTTAEDAFTATKNLARGRSRDNQLQGVESDPEKQALQLPTPVAHVQEEKEDDTEDPLPKGSVRSIGSELKGLARRMTRNTSHGDKNNSNCHDNHNNNNTNNNNNAPNFQIPPATKAPKETLKAVYNAGKYKAGLTLDVLSIQSFMAGIYIAAAGHLYLIVGGGVLGSALFPMGLIAVGLTSAELFTGDALVFVAAVLGKHVPFRKLLRNWTVAWCCNFIGSMVWAIFMGYLSGAIEDSHAKELAIAVAEKKALNEYFHIFLKAIGANFMVCVAVWQATTAEEVAGKCLALWFPTAAFVMMGFDHVVANMFLIPMGMLLGADVSVGRMFSALFVATCGNVIGGGFFVGFIYWYVFDSMSSFSGLTARIRANLRPNLKGMASRSFRPTHSSKSTKQCQTDMLNQLQVQQQPPLVQPTLHAVESGGSADDEQDARDFNV